MARLHLAVAMVTAAALLFVTFQLISSFGLPRFDYLHLHHVFEGLHDIPSNQIPINSPPLDQESSKDASRYLLGVGKADITG